jgi:transcriptional regulator with XRE-family HTH domain
MVGTRIRQARREKGVTQLGLAAKLQLLGVMIDRSGIAKLESGIRPVSDIEIVAICKVLDINILWLFEEKDKLLDEFKQDNEPDLMPSFKRLPK